jgi:hypothetical protein
VVAIGFLLLADNGNWHTPTNSFELQQATHSRYQLFAAGVPLKWISHIPYSILAKAAETVFLDLKSKFPSNV